MDYQKEYNYLINDIKCKLSKLSFDHETKVKFVEELSKIEKMVNSESNNFNYYEAFLKASKLEKSITSKSRIVLPPYESETFLAGDIKKTKKDISKYQQRLENYKNKLIAYLLTGTVFLTAGAYIIDRESKKPNDKLYLTETKTYHDNVDKVISYSTYQSAKKKPVEVVIKKIMPWVVDEDKATRYEYTYHINNVSYEEILYSKNYEKIITNLSYEEKIVTMNLEKYDDTLRYYEPFYEVTEIIQNKDEYIFQKKTISNETIIAIFTELLIYLLAININGGPIFESILNGASDINATSKVITAKKHTLELLKKQYQIKKKTLKNNK